MDRRSDCRNDPKVDRRRYLVRTAGAVGAVGTLGSLAGCLRNGDGGDGDDGDGDGGGSSATLERHASATGIDDEPVLGPALESATGVIVAFSDPACPTCRRFETGTFPTLQADHVETGEVAFVYRVFPITYRWGKPAVQALEATYERDAAAFWALKDHYYAEQRSFSADDVLDRTAAFLADHTALDADAVVTDAREKRFDARVQEDLQAGTDAGVAATPTFYLFRDAAFRTEVAGAKDASVFTAALGL